MSGMVECTCRNCGSRFHYSASAVRRGRGLYCSRRCASDVGRRKRWDAQAKTLFERYDDHVIRRDPNECWAWRGFKYNGYGRLKGADTSASVGAHRVSYLKHVGPIPVGQCVLHRCDNRECTNPAHLFLGDVYANNADRDAKGRQAAGERAGNAVLTDAKVAELRAVAAISVTAARLLGKHQRLSSSTVSHVLNRRIWKHVA